MVTRKCEAEDLREMIAGVVERGEGRRGLMACQWRLVDGDGRGVALRGASSAPCFCHRDEAIVFDGRDNEALKLRFFSFLLRVPLFVEIIPQIVCAS